MRAIRLILTVLLTALTSTAAMAHAEDAHPLGDDHAIAHAQSSLSALPTGDRIAWWAAAFINTPYDPDPLGLYVSSRRVVADEAVDCMYLTFRSAELALSSSPEAAIKRALDMRFIGHGELGADGLVANYDTRFEYAEDMIASGKWGRDITNTLARADEMPGSRMHKAVRYIPKARADEAIGGMRSGDIVYFIKDPAKRTVGEIVGHLGIVARAGDMVWLIHASGSKRKGGSVVKVSLRDYIAKMAFVGIKVTRF